jgi:YYY domain-containing protein
MTDLAEPVEKKGRSRQWVFDLLMLYVLLAALALRVVGLNWGEYQYLHPDERFLVWVGTDISPAHSLGEYFDTANSPLNPHNVGHGFYVYGTLPLFLARYAVQLIYGHSGFDEMTNVGRALSTIADLLTVWLVYLTASRLYDRRVGVLAGAFSAFMVLQIQQAHYFTVDSFATSFGILAIYFAVRVMKLDLDSGESEQGIGDEGREERGAKDPQGLEAAAAQEGGLAEIGPELEALRRFFTHPLFLLSVGFGVALGLAASSKVDAGALAILIPLALLVRLSRYSPQEQKAHFWQAVAYVAVAAFVSLLVFRLFQPYAFSGPGFFGLKPNQAWIANLKEQSYQSSVKGDSPPMMQWARRPFYFAWTNMIEWGMGLPLGLLAWAGFLWAAWRSLRGEWRSHLLILTWTGLFSLARGLILTPSMRYQLLVYPTLAILAGWAVVALWDKGQQNVGTFGRSYDKTFKYWRWAAVVFGGSALVLTAAYAVAFTGIYTRPITRNAASYWMYQNIPGPLNLHIQQGDGYYNQPVSYPYDYTITPLQPYTTSFEIKESGTLSEIYLAHVADRDAQPGTKALTLKLVAAGEAQPRATATVSSAFDGGADGRGGGYLATLSQPVEVKAGENYSLFVSLDDGQGAIVLQGTAVANEGDWDDGLPMRVAGYDAYGGIYTPGLNFNMYTDDNADKLARFISIMGQTDYIFISSNRQWGSLPRIPERFPMTTVYYRNLLGCPPEKDIVWCYSVAKPGMFQGSLGFDLVEVFQSNPTLGPISLNDQFAEEAFTVYDHPKVMIFRKNASYNADRVASLLGSVDFDQILRLPPGQYKLKSALLLLPSDRLQAQRSGGTWIALFSPDNPLNRFPALGVIAWYLGVFVLGLLAYPILRFGLPGLADRGYPLARTAGLLLLSYLVWTAGSAGIAFNRLTISAGLLLLALAGGGLAYMQRDGLRQEWRQNRRYFLIVEGLFLAFFLFDLFIRLGNPDLWHPYKGGEKPMDFSFFNAVLKSTTFPPYDPWYAGGYLNYYYYGFVFSGVLVKWLGITPEVAYNLIIPTLFSLIAMGAFSVGWNLFSAKRDTSSESGVKNGGAGGANEESGATGNESASVDRLLQSAISNQQSTIMHQKYLVGIFAALIMAVLGNLGTLKMILDGYQRVVAPGGNIEGAGFFSRLAWTFQGVVSVVRGAQLPYGIGDWYWNPSRVIPAPNDVEPITEFPFFTVLYADLHAHLFSLAITLLALTFILSVILSRGWTCLEIEGELNARSSSQPAASPRWLIIGIGFFLGALSISILRPTNTWDFYTYLALGAVVLAYALWTSPRTDRRLPKGLAFLEEMPENNLRLLVITVSVILLVALTLVLSRPFSEWYGQGYNKLGIWKGTHTPLSAYLTHWGLFLFLIVSWMAWETREWMAQTPLSALRKLEPYRLLIIACLAGLAVAVVGFQVWVTTLPEHGLKAPGIAWLTLPLALWAGVLILRRGLPDTKRLVLFMVGTGLVLTTAVEVIVLVGDIGRMNTVFKFYLQVWTLFAVSAAASLGWLLSAFHRWYPRFRLVWQVALAFLVGSAALYPVTAGMAKVKDRMVTDAPHTLDGMIYMDYAHYDWKGDMDLSQDYRAIRWMQENVQGSPVIVEANLRDLYRWGSRFTIYTGLPGVVGWEWHEQQQRALLPADWVSNRITEIEIFYTGNDPTYDQSFLKKYDVRYIIVGQLERNVYPGPGLDKFAAEDGTLWRSVYHDQATTIYEVIPQ